MREGSSLQAIFTVTEKDMTILSGYAASLKTILQMDPEVKNYVTLH